ARPARRRRLLVEARARLRPAARADRPSDRRPPRAGRLARAPPARRVERRARVVAEDVSSRTQRRIVGVSAEWREVLSQATRVAKTDTTVLVTGESGTGKEGVVRL